MPAGGETEKKVTDTFTIKFEPASDWEFIRWKIVDSNTQTELENGDYLELSTLTDSETECTFLKSPGAEMALSLVPVMAERPQIISNTPQSSGVLKDTSIQVLFDHDMDEASIYYTQDEMNQLLKEGTAASPLFTETILNEGGEEETVYKRYEKDGKTFFKNIFISNKREGTNLNEAFEPPVFENSSSLIIRTKRVEKQNGASTHLEPLIQDYTQILVSVEKGMSYQMEGKSVGLAGSKRWMYNVGDGIDNIALNITSRTCDVKESGNTETLALDQNFSDEPNPSDIRSLTFFDGNSLDVDLDITVNDPASSNGSSGSGPRTFFKVNLNKVYDGRYYKLASPALIKEKTVDYNKNIRADSASFEGTVALDDLNLSDGVYELSFVFSDISGNDRISGGKYLAVDKSTPEPVTIVTCKYNSSSSLTLSWEKPASHGRDIVYSLSYSTDGTSWSSPVSCESLSKDFSISSSNNYYIYKVVAEDARGRKSTATRKTYAKKMSVLWNKGFVEVEGASVSGTVSPSSSVFINGRTVHIPDLIVCDHEVTQKEYAAYCKYGSSSPSATYGIGDNFPAYYVSWYDAVVYCNLRSMAEGLTPVYKMGNETDPKKWSGIEGDASTKYCGPSSSNSIWNTMSFDASADGYRLPTEAEWEYMARGENKKSYTYSGSDTIGDVAWYSGNSGSKTHDVKTKNANTLGIYDMTGNVREWCWDWYGSISSSTSLAGASSGSVRVSRGASWSFRVVYCGVYRRDEADPECRGSNFGFRVVRNAD